MVQPLVVLSSESHSLMWVIVFVSELVFAGLDVIYLIFWVTRTIIKVCSVCSILWSFIIRGIIIGNCTLNVRGVIYKAWESIVLLTLFFLLADLTHWIIAINLDFVKVLLSSKDRILIWIFLFNLLVQWVSYAFSFSFSFRIIDYLEPFLFSCMRRSLLIIHTHIVSTWSSAFIGSPWAIFTLDWAIIPWIFLSYHWIFHVLLTRCISIA